MLLIYFSKEICVTEFVYGLVHRNRYNLYLCTDEAKYTGSEAVPVQTDGLQLAAALEAQVSAMTRIAELGMEYLRSVAIIIFLPIPPS